MLLAAGLSHRKDSINVARVKRECRATVREIRRHFGVDDNGEGEGETGSSWFHVYFSHKYYQNTKEPPDLRESLDALLRIRVVAMSTDTDESGKNIWVV